MGEIPWKFESSWPHHPASPVKRATQDALHSFSGAGQANLLKQTSRGIPVTTLPTRTYKYLVPITGLFAATLVISNTMESKVFDFGPLALTAGTIIFPLAYLFNDVLTEVYGYAAARRVIWTGFAAMVLMSVFYAIAVALPPSGIWTGQEGYAATLGVVPRIAFASVIAYFCGEFVNSYIVAKMKVAMQGKKMGLRFVASTMVGETIDTAIFMMIAFTGVFAPAELLTIGLSMWAVKVAWEIIALPMTLFIVKKLKQAEHEDHYDTNTNFNPFMI